MANAWKKMGSLRGPAGAGADVATSKKTEQIFDKA